MQNFRRQLAIILLISTTAIAALAQSGNPTATTMDSPAAAASAEPNLFATADGRVFLSWIEKLSETRHALKFSTLDKGRWTAPRLIAEGDNWFVNWADFPSLVALDDKTLIAHWLVKSGADTYAYNVNIARSTDGGKSWGKPITPHRDGTQTEHGFVSLVPLKQGRVGAVWLDGRKFTSKGHDGHGSSTDEMTLRYATIDGRGNLADETEIDARACECCQTAAAATSEGLIVAYRDRSEKEVRDISVARLVNGKWTKPQTIYADNWEINGCPVNGPSVAASGSKVVVAWFTGAKDKPTVKAVFSNDAGATVGGTIQVDDGKPIGRVETLMLADGSAVVVWLEKTDKGAEVRARRIHADGKRGASVTVAESSAARSSGFPQMARSSDQLIFAWTDATKPSHVRVAEVSLKALNR